MFLYFYLTSDGNGDEKDVGGTNVAEHERKPKREHSEKNQRKRKLFIY